MNPSLGFLETVKFVMLKHYGDYDGRARRREYWLFHLFFCLLITIVAITLCLILSIFMEFQYAQLFTLIILVMIAIIFANPLLSLAVRRLHDTGRSGWFIFISLIPFVGWFIHLYFMCSDSQDAINDYGPSPKYTADTQNNNSQNLIETNSPVYPNNPSP